MRRAELAASALAWLTCAAIVLGSSRASAEPRSPQSHGPGTLQEGEWTPQQNDELEAHHLRSWLEMGGGLALGAAGYWLLMDRQIADWDNPNPEERFNGRAWRFDNNSLPMNFLGHPFSGAEAHAFARANHHGVLASFAYGFATSFLWEFVLEFKEKVSVNDLIATPAGGLPLGEFLYKLGLYLDTSVNPGTGTEIARWVLGTGVTLDRALDGRRRPVVRTRDALGFSSAIWHEFSVHYALAVVESPREDSYLLNRAGFYGKLVTLPGYLSPRSFGRGFHRAEISALSVATEASEHGVGLLVDADTILAGYHVQSMGVSKRGESGAAATLGTNMAYSFLLSTANLHHDFAAALDLPEPRLKHHVPTRKEQFGAVHLPGLAVDWHARAPSLSVSASARLNPSFAGVSAPAFYDWSAANLDEKGKHVTHRQGYFFGWGGAGSLRGAVAAGPLRATGNVLYGRYDSQDGLDRHVERITVDVEAEADVLFYGATLGVKPSFAPFCLSAEFGVRRWRSNVERFERGGRIVERGLQIQSTF